MLNIKQNIDDVPDEANGAKEDGGEEEDADKDGDEDELDGGVHQDGVRAGAEIGRPRVEDQAQGLRTAQLRDQLNFSVAHASLRFVLKSIAVVDNYLKKY